MKKLLLSLLLIFFIAFRSFPQSITSIRSNTFEKYTTEHGVPKEIINKNTFYNDSGKEVNEEKIIFSKNLDTISELRYKNSELDARLMFIFDRDKNLIFRSFNNKVPLLGWQSQHTEYNYDENGLKEIIDYDANKNISRKALITNDLLGSPVSLKLYDFNNRLLGYEKADYDYENNVWTYKVYDANDNLKTTRGYIINSKRSDSSEYNEFGDVILYPRNWNNNDNIFYLIEYRYDDLGNWIEKKIYEVEKKGDRLGKKIKDRRLKRKIKYW